MQAAEAGKAPTIDSFAGYQVDGGSVLDESGDSWMAGLRMNYSLFDGGRTSASIAMAEARLRQAKAMLARTALALDLEVQQAELEYSQAGQRLQVTEKMVGVAEETGQAEPGAFQGRGDPGHRPDRCRDPTDRCPGQKIIGQGHASGSQGESASGHGPAAVHRKPGNRRGEATMKWEKGCAAYLLLLGLSLLPLVGMR